jgi:hypothetical protein
MPRLSEVLKNQVKLTVAYRSKDIEIVYKPESVNDDTQTAIDERIAKGEIKPRHSDAAFLAEVISSWDYTDDDDVSIPPTFEVMKSRSMGMQLALITAIYDDQRNPQNPPKGT